MRNWVWFWLQLEDEYANQKGLLKRLFSSPQYQENPKIPEPRSHEHDYTCIFHKSYRLVQQFDKWTTRWSHQETPACAKHSCQTSFQSKEIWLHTCCTCCASLASSEILIDFKTLLIIFKGLHGKASCTKHVSWMSLNESTILSRKRAFAVCGLLAWNSLPKEIGYADVQYKHQTVVVGNHILLL